MEDNYQPVETAAPPAGVGAQLRAAREARGLTLEQVAAQTRIPLRHLDTIESGDFSRLPGRTYAVGFARTYAKTVGLDQADVVAMVRAELDQQSGVEDQRPATFEPGDPARVPSRGLGWFAVFALILLLAGGFFFFRAMFAPAGELPSLVEQEQAEEAAQAPTAAGQQPQAAATGGAVVFTALDGPVWVKFYDASATQLMQAEMARGDTYTVPADANGPMIWTGRPEALAITVGGRSIPKLAEVQTTMKDVPVTAEALLARNQRSTAPTAAPAGKTDPPRRTDRPAHSTSDSRLGTDAGLSFSRGSRLRGKMAPDVEEDFPMSFTVRQASRNAMAALVMAGCFAMTAPAAAQSDEARLRKLEAEVRALQRTVFPNGDGRFFTPEVVTQNAQQPGQRPVGTPSETAVTDILARLDALESQLSRLTARSEENANAIAELETRVANSEARPVADQPAAAAQPPGAAPRPDTSTTTPTPTPAAAQPSAERVAAVRAIEKPATGDAGEDEYTYGFRLWDAKFYPEAQQQLKLFVDRYPRHERISFGRNLLGRAYLDGGDPRTAATFFFDNYTKDPNGARAPDSLLLLAESMIALNDTARACRALAEFGEKYPALATGRLKSQYDKNRGAVRCR